MESKKTKLPFRKNNLFSTVNKENKENKEEIIVTKKCKKLFGLTTPPPLNDYVITIRNLETKKIVQIFSIYLLEEICKIENLNSFIIQREDFKLSIEISFNEKVNDYSLQNIIPIKRLIYLDNTKIDCNKLKQDISIYLIDKRIKILKMLNEIKLEITIEQLNYLENNLFTLNKKLRIAGKLLKKYLLCKYVYFNNENLTPFQLTEKASFYNENILKVMATRLKPFFTVDNRGVMIDHLIGFCYFSGGFKLIEKYFNYFGLNYLFNYSNSNNILEISKDIDNELIQQDKLVEIQKILKYEFKNMNLLKQCLIHYSASNIYNNERIEYLGDAVFDILILDELLIQSNPFNNNRYLSTNFRKVLKLMAKNTELEKLCFNSNLDKYLIINDKIKDKKSVVKKFSDLFESIIGAIYIDCNYDLNRTREITKHLWINSFNQYCTIAHQQLEKKLKLEKKVKKLSYKNNVKEIQVPFDLNEFQNCLNGFYFQDIILFFDNFCKEYIYKYFTTQNILLIQEQTENDSIVCSVYLFNELIGEGYGINKERAKTIAYFTSLQYIKDNMVWFTYWYQITLVKEKKTLKEPKQIK
ncbi:hypothetical protein ABK040_001640 [Willaertia magna]